MLRPCGRFLRTKATVRTIPATRIRGVSMQTPRPLSPRHSNQATRTTVTREYRTTKEARTYTARLTRGRCRIAPLHSYFESHDLRCSSKKARTCSGSSAPRNSTPAGSGSGQKTLSGVGIFGGLASMIFLLYEPIICLGPRFAPVSDASHMFSVALTAQADT